MIATMQSKEAEEYHSVISLLVVNVADNPIGLTRGCYEAQVLLGEGVMSTRE